MSQSLPSLNSLRAFEAAGRHLSFSKAAEELHVTPAAVSQQVKSLEEHLDVQLFHRLNRGLALTDAGLAGLPQLQTAFCVLTKGVERIRGAEGHKLLAVEAAPSFTAKWLLPRLPLFSAEHPDVDLRIAASLGQIDAHSSQPDVRDDFRTGEVSLGIRFGGGEYPGCRVDRLFRVAAVPLCSPRLMTGKRALCTPEVLAAELGECLLNSDVGTWLIKRYIAEGLDRAEQAGDPARVAELRRVLANFSEAHPTYDLR